MTVTDWFPGQGVTGFIADAGSAFDPVVDGYPTSNPTTGFTTKNEGFAGVIHGAPTGGGATLNLYCIDINTDTWGGIGYALGSWDASNVKNVGYVARILNDYYPNTNEPAALTDLNQKADAVQAAIWFFSDPYVVNTGDSVHAATVEIVDQVRAEGPLVKPPPPSLTITPATVSGPHRVLGPFTVSTNAPGGATVRATGADMFGVTGPIAPGATVPSGQKIWLHSSGPSGAVLQATSEATVPSGSVYLYDGYTDAVNDAQRLILAENATLDTTVQATAEFLASGKLIVTKTIAGGAAGMQGPVVIHAACDDGVARHDFIIPVGTPAGKTIAGPLAGHQGPVTIHVVCNGTAPLPDFSIAAGAPAGSVSQSFGPVPAGSVCTVTETADGATDSVGAIVSGNGETVTVPAGEVVPVNVMDVYERGPSPVPDVTGSLGVTKTIAGPGAGQQGRIAILVDCGDRFHTYAVLIPARAHRGSVSRPFPGLPAGSRCTVAETANGHTSTVEAVTGGGRKTVTIGVNRRTTVHLTDMFFGVSAVSVTG